MLLFSLSGKNKKNIIIFAFTLGQELATILGMSRVKRRNGELILLAQNEALLPSKDNDKMVTRPEQEEMEPGHYEESLFVPTG